MKKIIKRHKMPPQPECSSTATCSLVYVTPEMATGLLANNGKNRNIRRGHVNNIVKEIARSEWQPDASVIRVGEDGSVMDGQHRLSAIEKHGGGVWSWVMQGCTNGSMPKIDSGKSRTIRDRIRLAGDDRKYAGVYMSIAKMVACLDTGSVETLSESEYMEYWDLYSESFDWFFAQPFNLLDSVAAGIVGPLVWLHGNGHPSLVGPVVNEMALSKCDDYSSILSHISRRSKKEKNTPASRISLALRTLRVMMAKDMDSPISRDVRTSATGYDYFAVDAWTTSDNRCGWRKGCGNERAAVGGLCQIHSVAARTSQKSNASRQP
jgi:hypothetical protein